MVNEYIRPDGYRIRASEKAYNMLYKKNGFVPVEAAAPIGETTAAEIAVPIEDAVESTEKASKANKGKKKADASKPKSDAAAKDISGQEEVSEDETDSNPADQDAAEQPEGE